MHVACATAKKPYRPDRGPRTLERRSTSARFKAKKIDGGGTLADVTSDETLSEAQLQLAIDWSEAATTLTLPANQFVVQLGARIGDKPDGIHLVVGFLAPPIVTSNDPRVREDQISALGGKLGVQVHGRYVMTRERVEELIGVLQSVADQYDAVMEGQDVADED